MKNKLLLLPLLLLVVTASQAETRYVSDKLEIFLRGGAGTNYRIRAGLDSGEAVQILEENGEGWSRVTTSKGTEGWVLTRQLQKLPAARDRLAKVQREAAEVAGLKQQIKTLTAERNQLQASSSKLANQHKELREIAADTIALKDRHDAMQTQLAASETEREQVAQENIYLRDNTRRDWFIYGGAVLLVGLILGLLVPHLPLRNRRDSWGA